MSDDTLDSLLTSTVGSRTNLHSYDTTKNRLNSISSNISNFYYSYDFDSQGNIKQRGNQLYIFDQGNRMTSATSKADYVYDALGHRLRVNHVDGTSQLQIYSPAGQLLTIQQTGGPNNGKQTNYIYLNRHVIAEVTQ
ncbi:hypothetical protein QN372_03465 [Undibacterium sp. RTI2.1]|uniref:hypothetical protein n=1 Tax=unclassified Undibacterium TaxID=2630295 RepID=UPI002AB37932|nr:MULTISPECIES: hypothetical protein [unclassified Undibacterium]MDY7537165.1 hypothetical protein [Undibacterium sp. 5I1]MEB0029796.1 hypothetical protein [Undibacterium sp. RTI2.1]MEB0115081.1 hypothetical protein [Undibacterium sp. RTI2.2]MEB0229344.1 hypothetical protein [Undibacterium sp. 10I3]MEB0256109.1 hypothetical protein [Undibacterium sp. 5I1]